MAIYTLSLFSGAAMLDQGIELAFGEIFRPVAYVECEAFAVAVLTEAMESERIHPAPVWSDARTVCGTQFSHYIREAGGVDAIIAGYPCPDFSCAGKRRGMSGPKGSLWWNVAEAIAEYEPELLFLENVGGHTSEGFDSVASAIRQMGYRIAAGLFTAAETGATHERERLFILAQSIGSGTGSESRATGGNGRTQSIRQRNGTAGPVRTTTTNGELADSQSIGVQGNGACGFQELQAYAGQGLPLCDSIPLFPPGSGDGELAEWRRILDIAPTLEPTLCILADGMADRPHQLRLLGNGVVPLEAAYAYTTLAACLFT